MKIALLLFIPLVVFSQDLEYLDVDIYQIENAPPTLPVDFFPEEDPYEGVVKPSIIEDDPEFSELIKIHELTPEFRASELKADPSFKTLDNLIPPKKIYKELAKQEKEIPEGEPQNFNIYLKKGTRIKDLKFHYAKTVYRDIHVLAVREYPSAPFFKILDRKGKPRFEVSAKDVKYINETIDLSPTPKKFEVQTKGPQNEAYDEKGNFEHVLALNIENWDSSYFNNLTKNGNTADARAIKVDYKFYHLWDFPLNFGLLISYENGNWDPDWKWNSFYFGMGMKIPWNIASWIVLEGQINWQTSLFFSLEGANSYKLSNNYVGLSGELTLKTGFGNYFLGVQYKKIYWSAQNQPIEVSGERSDSSAVGFNLGVKFNSIFKL